MDKVKVSRAVAALEGRGWVRRRADGADRRVSHLSLTDAGRAAVAEIGPRMLAAEAAILARLGPAERARLEAAMDDLEAALDQLP